MPDFCVRITSKLVEISSDCASEENRILWNDEDATSKIVECDGSNVDVINDDVTMDECGHSKERMDERGLACTSSTDNANLFSWMDDERDVVKSKWCMWMSGMRHANIIEENATLRWPIIGWMLVGRVGFLFEFTIL